jgi:hypothetical protein
MNIKEFEKYLKKEGSYYYRPNITVHYYEDEETGKRGFWGNYKGDETEDFDSIQALMDAHSWVEIPDSIDGESFPMCRKLPKINKYEIVWEGIRIEIVHKSKWVSTHDHIEVRAGQPLPITETGYRSIFLTDVDIEETGGVIELVKGLLNEGAKSQKWQQCYEESKQESLF